MYSKKKRESSDTNFQPALDDVSYHHHGSLEEYIEKSQNDIKTGNSPSASAPTSPLLRTESTPVLIPKITSEYSSFISFVLTGQWHFA
jgi:hypothetical protein